MSEKEATPEGANVVAAQTAERPASPWRRLRWWLGTAIVGGSLAAGSVFWVYPTVRGEYHWRQAHHFIEQEEFADAVEHLKGSMAVWPRSAEVHFLYAQTARRTGALEEAKEHLGRAKELGWDQEAIDAEWLFLEAQQGEFWGALPTLTAYVQSGSHLELHALEVMAYGALEANNSLEALRWTSMWVHRYPQSWRARLLRAGLFEQAERPEFAITDYEAVLAARPQHYTAAYRRADLIRRQDRYNEALPLLIESHQLRPDAPEAAVSLARCYRSLGRSEEALTFLSEWVKNQREEYDEAFTLIGWLEHDLEHSEEALEWFRKAERIRPDLEETVNGLAAVLRQLGKVEEAERYDRKARDLSAKFSELLQATRDIRRNPRDLASMIKAGVLLGQLGFPDQGARWFRHVLMADAGNRAANENLSNYYLGKGQLDLAQKHRQAAEGQLKVNVERKGQ